MVSGRGGYYTSSYLEVIIRSRNRRDEMSECVECRHIVYRFCHSATVPPELMSSFQLIPYQSAEGAVYKALGVE